jgi:hypothetical protein
MGDNLHITTDAAVLGVTKDAFSAAVVMDYFGLIPNLLIVHNGVRERRP